MSDQPRKNEFSHVYTSYTLAAVLSSCFAAAEDMLIHANPLFRDEQQHRGQMYIILARLATIIEDAQQRITELAIAEAAEKDIQDGGL